MGDVEESEEEQIVTVPDVDQDGVHDLDMIDSLVDEGIGDVEEQWSRNARCNNEEYRGSKMGQARDRGKTGASADVADDLHRDEAAGLPGNNILDCQESQVAQWLALECFPKCVRVFSRFHAGPGQAVLAGEVQSKSDVMLVLRGADAGIDLEEEEVEKKRRRRRVRTPWEAL